MPDTRAWWRCRPAARGHYRPRPQATPRRAQCSAGPWRAPRRQRISAANGQATSESIAQSDSGPLRTRLTLEEVLVCDLRVSSVSGAVACGERQPIPACRLRTEACDANWWTKGAEFRQSLAGNFRAIGLGGPDRGPCLFLHHELGAREFRKPAAFGDQFIESSTFDHAPAVEHQNFRGVADCGKPMCDHESGTPLHHLIQRRIDL